MSYMGLSAEAFRCLRDMPAAGVESIVCDPITREMLETRGLVRLRNGRWYLTATGTRLRDADVRLTHH